MKIAIITDTHWGVRNDNVVFANHISSFYAEQFFPYIDQHGIDTVFHLGDVCDRRKYINYATAARLEKDLFEPLADRNLQVYMVVGNHDTYFKNTNSINSLKQLYGHSKYADTVNMYWDHPVEVDMDGETIMLCPWICAENAEVSLEMLKETKAQVVMGHFEIQGFEMYKGAINHEGMGHDIFSKFDVVCSGHFHHKSSHNNIHYLGAPYEMTWGDYDDPRGFHVYDTEKRELTFIQNPYRLFHKLWYNDTDKNFEEYTNHFNYEDYKDTYVKVIVQNKTNPYLFDVILDNLYKANPAHISIVEDNKNMDQQSEEEIISEAEDTLTSLYKYVDNMKTNIDKNRLNQLFADLYTEAQNVEL